MSSHELNELTVKLLSATRENNMLLERLKEAENDRDEAVNQSLQFSEIMKKALNEIKSLNDLNGLLKQKCDLTDSVIEEYKGKLEAFRNQQNGSSVVDLTEQLLKKTKELEHSNSINIKLLNDNQNTRKDMEGMFEVLSGLENQMNMYTSREEEVEQLTKQSEDKIKEANAMEEEFIVRDEEYRRVIQRLNAENKSLTDRLISSIRKKQSSSSAESQGNDSDVDTNFATAGSLDFQTVDDMIENSNSLDDTNSCLEDSQISSFFINYCGPAVPLREATRVLGFEAYSAEDTVAYILSLANKESGLITQSTYQRGLAKLVAMTYISITVLQRSISDYIIDAFFSILDNGEAGTVNAHEVGCGILLFCEGDVSTKAGIAWELLLTLPTSGEAASEEDDDDETVELYAVIQALSALYKAHSCLDPSVAQTQGDYKSVADSHAISEIYQYWSNYKRGLGQGSGHNFQHMSTRQRVLKGDFMRMFIVTMSKLQRNILPLPDKDLQDSQDEEEEEEDDSQDSDYNTDDAEEDEANESGDDERDYGSSDEEDEEEQTTGLRVETHVDRDVDAQEEDEVDLYLNDDLFPPSAVMMELRAARAILGLEHMAADTMLESLGAACHAGFLNETRWKQWLWDVIDASSTSELDTHMARNLGHKIYAAFDAQSTGEVAFSRIAAGLSFLCGGSPLEDKLMVAFAVVDEDSDGYINGEQFGGIAHAVLVLVATCSKLVTKKIVASGVSVSDLSGAAAKEGLTALSLTEDDTEISFEMLSEISEDFVKLSALF